MKVVALKGVAYSGKTPTLNILREMLRKEGLSLSDTPGSGDTPEAFKIGDLIIGVAPGGDFREVVDNNLRFFREHKCDVGFTACRTKWGPMYALDDFEKLPGNTVIRVQKCYEFGLSESTKDFCNHETAQLLRDMI